jgi:hypothetical protein
MYNTLNAVTWQGGRRDLWQNSTVTVNCSGVVSLEEYLLDDLSIHPNPTKGKVFINDTEKLLSISVYNIFGKEIIVNANNNTIDLTQIVDGVYFIAFTGKYNIITKKIILSK